MTHLEAVGGGALVTNKHNNNGTPVTGASYAHYHCASAELSKWGWYVRADVHPDLREGRCSVCGGHFIVKGREGAPVEAFAQHFL